MSSLDRRSFLFGKKKEAVSDDALPAPLLDNEVKSAVIDRRHFLAGILALGLSHSTDAHSESREDTREGPRTYSREHSFSGREYTRTALETGLVFLANLATEKVFGPYVEKEFGLKLGSATTEEVHELLASKPFRTFFSVTLANPIAEEALHRMFPAMLLNEWFGGGFNFGKGPHAWSIALPVTLLFAVQHNVTRDGFDCEHIPLSQFVGGLFLWHLMRSKGIDHAVLAHSVYNAAYVGVSLPLSTRFP